MLKYRELVRELQYDVQKVGSRSFMAVTEIPVHNFLCLPLTHIRTHIHTHTHTHRQLVPLGLFELHCDEVLRSLTKRAELICNQLISRMSQDNQKLNQA